jgi:exopolyphosphatase/guanosine-5'-triphosphate,3'-diphosphate pyrophosphatase
MSLPRFAALDIGTNTVRLILGERTGPENFRPLKVMREITRLGGHYTPSQGLQESAIQRTIQGIERMVEAARKAGAKEIFAAATGVVRRAINRQSFLEKVHRQTGLTVRLLPGQKEGQLTWKGICWALKGEKKNCFAADIGGGSTECIWAVHGKVKKIKSFPWGAVTLCEKFLAHDPPTPSELRGLEEHIQAGLRRLRIQWEKEGLAVHDLHPDLIGTAGTITTLAAIHLGLRRYDPEKIHRHRISKAEVQRLYRKLSFLPLAERRKIPGLEKGREDLIISGTAQLVEILEIFEFRGLRVVDSGLLEGILLEGLRRTP